MNNRRLISNFFYNSLDLDRKPDSRLVQFPTWIFIDKNPDKTN